MAKRPEEEEDGSKSGLFPLFAAAANSIAGVSSSPQWLCNASFTTDLAAANATVSSFHSDERGEGEEEEAEEHSLEGKQREGAKYRSYELLEDDEAREESRDSDRDSGKEKRERRNKEKKHKRKRKRAIEDYSRSVVSAARVLDECYSNPAKDYYLDTRPDSDNLTYGSLYRMNVPRYRIFNYDKLPGHDTRMSYLRNLHSSLLDEDVDIDLLDARVRSDCRYWSAKYVALERHKNFKHVRFIAPREAVVTSTDHFIPLSDTLISSNGDNSSLSKNLIVEESWEDEVLNKTREFNKLTREHPHDEKPWIAFAEFQDKVASKQTHKGVRLQTLEKKISILEKAAELNPDNEEILITLLKAYQHRDNAEVLIGRWEKALMHNPASYKMWREFMHVVQGEFSRFKVSEVRKMYSHAISALSSVCSKRLRQVDITSKPSDPDIIQQELGLVDMFISLCRFEWQAGYQELATALFQAEMEFSIFSPSLLLTEQSKHRLFEHFWSSDGARVGEEGALGWSLWLEKEDENRQRIARDESSECNDEGGWTGWSLPQSIQNYCVTASETLEVSDMAPENVEEETEDGATEHEDDAEALLKLLGISVDAGSTDEVNDASAWAKWSEEESSRDRDQWMPVRKSGGTSNLEGKSDGEEGEQFSRVILYEDVNEYLFSINSTEARLSLVYQMIEFFGGHTPPWTCTNSPGWKEKINSVSKLADSILESLRKAHNLLRSSLNGSGGFTLDFLSESANDISMRTEMMKFLRNAILLCLTAFPRNYILEEAVFVAEELFVTNMKSLEASTTPCQALAKRLLKSDRQDLLLCGVYARREAAFGNMDHARRVFDMALSSIGGLPMDLQSNAPLLYLWYAESELANNGASFPEKLPSSYRAMHILSCMGGGLTYSPFKGQPSSLQLLRARQGFNEKIKRVQLVWAHGVIDDQSAAVVCSAALFEELTNEFAAAAEILEHMFAAVLPGRRSQSHQLEFLFNYYVRMLQRHHKQISLSKLWASISQGLQLYPFNPEFYRALVEIYYPRTTTNKLRMMFDDFACKESSIIVWLFALTFEASKGGSHNRIRGLFERALANHALRDAVILWRCYMTYEIEIARNPSAARRIFFRAIHACPWSKTLWLEGFVKLNSVLTAKELSDLQEVMREKELNIRTDIYEILLQDDLVT